MRNLAQYPISAEECIDHLEYYGDREIKSGFVGGTGPYVVKLVCEFLENNKEFKEFVNSKMP